MFSECRLTQSFRLLASICCLLKLRFVKTSNLRAADVEKVKLRNFVGSCFSRFVFDIMEHVFHMRGSFLLLDKLSYCTIREKFRIVAKPTGLSLENLTSTQNLLPAVLLPEQARFLFEQCGVKCFDLESPDDSMDSRNSRCSTSLNQFGTFELSPNF